MFGNPGGVSGSPSSLKRPEPVWRRRDGNRAAALKHLRLTAPTCRTSGKRLVRYFAAINLPQMRRTSFDAGCNARPVQLLHDQHEGKKEVWKYVRMLALLVVLGEGLIACAHNEGDHQSQAADVISERCIDRESSAQSVAAITRYSPLFDDPHVVTVFGIQSGSIWFLKEDEPVLALHVAKSLGLSSEEWTPVEIYQNQRDAQIHRHQRIRARLLRTIAWGLDGLAVLKLEKPFQGARALAIRAEPPKPGEKVITPAYPGGFLELTEGHFLGIDLELSNERKEGSYAIEIDGNRLALDNGASGAPVLDCRGQVVAAVSAQFYLASENGLDEATPRGQKTNEAVPVTILADSYSEPPGQ